MKVVTRGVQDLYQNKVIDEFYSSINRGLTIDEAFTRAVILARGISYGGSCIGFEYNYDRCVKALTVVYDSCEERMVNR